MPHETIRALMCSAADRRFCLDLAGVLAVERGARLIPHTGPTGPAPTSPAAWIVRAGKRIPVYGLAERLGIGPPPLRAGAVIVFDHASPWALAADDVSRFERDLARTDPIPAFAGAAAWFRGSIVHDGAVVLCLDPARLHPLAPTPPAAPDPVSLPRAAAAPRRPSPIGRLLLFSPANPSARLVFGLSYTEVIEILAGARLTAVPGAPPHILGLVPWRGRSVPVLDAGALLGLEPLNGGTGRRLVIARSAGAPVALPAGGEVRTQSLPFPHRDAASPSVYARGAFEIGGGRLLVLPHLDRMAAPSCQLPTLRTPNIPMKSGASSVEKDRKVPN